MKDKCGVVAIYGNIIKEASNFVYLSLHALQHRGQESAGITTVHNHKLIYKKGVGRVADIFNKDTLQKLPGKIAIGHVRYSTAGDSTDAETQPIISTVTQKGFYAVAHNGNITNADFLRNLLVKEGRIFQSFSDTEIITHLIARSPEEKFSDCVADAVSHLSGAYSLVILRDGEIIALRDPHGYRPLFLGRLEDNSFIIASETCAFDLVNASCVREILPGEMLVVNRDGVVSKRYSKKECKKFCSFEYIYFSRPDSIINGISVHNIRKEFGRQLALESTVKGDIVIAVPDSGISSALGFSEASGIPYEYGIVRNHYVGRTFIEPKQSIRNFGVKLKFNVIKDVVCDKKVILIDDSIVRATTSKKIIDLLKISGASEVHVKITSPPVIKPCYYGIDTPSVEELIASNHSIDEIRDYIKADSLDYLKLESMKKIIQDVCTSCFE